MNNILAVIVTFNRKELLKECVENLLKQTYKNLDILVVDNCSTDGTEDYIRTFIDSKQIKYHNTGKNIGGAGGFSEGIKIGVKENYEYLWIMDDDSMAKPDALLELMIAVKHLNDEFGFLCSNVLWTDGSPCVMNVPNIGNKWQYHHKSIEKGILAVQQCSFVSCFVKSGTVRKVGLPIKEFFIWGDDAEYTKRISNEYPSFFVSKSCIIHKMNSNIPTDISQDSKDRLFRYQFSYRNMYYVNKMQGNKMSMILYYYGIYLDIKKILKSNIPGKRKKISIMLKSVREGRKFHPRIEYPD